MEFRNWISKMQLFGNRGMEEYIEMIIQLEYLDIYIALFHTNLEQIIRSDYDNTIYKYLLFADICVILHETEGNRFPP